jgi:hypothetical protein
MSWVTGTATDHADLLNKLDAFLTSQGMCTSPAYAGIGNGLVSALIGGSASIGENITVAMTSATAFSVTGSSSGSLGTGTVGTPFVNTKVNFTITAGGVAFIAGDTWTFSTTPPWVSKRRTAGVEMIWQAPGNGGLNQIFVGAQVFSNVTGDYYNWRLGGFTAFDAALTFQNQAGYIGGPGGQTHPSPVTTIWNQPMTYWFIANGRRVVMVAKVSTVYVIAYLGFLQPYVSPNVFPYPCCVGGNLQFVNSEPAATSASWRWSYQGSEMNNCSHSSTVNSGVENTGSIQMRNPSGTWHSFIRPGDSSQTAPAGKVWPFVCAWSNWAKNLDGGYSMLPIVLGDASPSAPNIWGELDGVEAITGFQNGSENTVTIGNSIYLVVQNVFRNTQTEFAAVKLI